MSFANPGYLFLLLLLVPIIGWYIYELHKSDASVQISNTATLKRQDRSIRLYLLHVPFVLRTAIVILLTLALARPQLTNRYSNKDMEGIDIMMSLDISGTMLAEDLKPNRLEAAKNVAKEFIANRENDQIGLVLFAGQSFTQCPLTTDHAALTNLFSMVQFGMIEDGTAIGLGLANAVNRIKDSPTKSKVIILLTDGSNNRGDIAPKTAAEIAKTYGMSGSDLNSFLKDWDVIFKKDGAYQLTKKYRGLGLATHRYSVRFTCDGKQKLKASFSRQLTFLFS